jgi:hypothetical protein
MKRSCPKCKKIFFENELEVIHDYPKYLGGKDSDGRHLLCIDCHTHYDFCILSEIYYNLYKIQIPYYIDRRKYIPLMNRIKREGFKEIFSIVVKKVKEEFFND